MLRIKCEKRTLYMLLAFFTALTLAIGSAPASGFCRGGGGGGKGSVEDAATWMDLDAALADSTVTSINVTGSFDTSGASVTRSDVTIVVKSGAERRFLREGRHGHRDHPKNFYRHV